MSKKYHRAPQSPKIITNDLFLASFLHCVDCHLFEVKKNERQRVSFVFVGKQVKELREAFRSEKVELDMNAFRQSMNLMRREMDAVLKSCRAFPIPNERSYSCPQPHQMQTATA